ncbi:MAG: amino-acid N-acetyltransferase [Burkholderiaceae bacterium]|jgi:amino-acid N-acetyltransferase|nr:amino-acid N-acetyltransferase [Actinomycetota bacterium]NCX66752.1 amino-acid N-acetyltransferase [Burkholderiaceae bacterium]NCU89594.1 amino-acid N-acetyltransferase [Actinomycetota bacterium]NCZ80203.1 amino-acid N-acetyltransferase [Burkholderiaceae bacterium]NDA03179.1 amino-acid N-acetyltransferase [Burkholderiaceae bacterium]
MSVTIRPAKTSDIKAIRAIIDTYSLQRRLLSKETVMLYEDVQEFFVAEKDNKVIGCGALHVLWEDLGEVRTVAVVEEFRGQNIGHQIMSAIIDRAQSLGLKRLFCLTFETGFFGKHGFTEIHGAPVEPEVYQQLLRSYDEGIAEFLDLESVKPNTLGNTRMLKIL